MPRAPWMLLVLPLGQGSREIRSPSGGAGILLGAVRCSGEEFHPGAVLCCPCSEGNPQGDLRPHLSVKELSRARPAAHQAPLWAHPSPAAISSQSKPPSMGCQHFEWHTMNPWLTSPWGTKPPTLHLEGYSCQDLHPGGFQPAFHWY